MPSGQSLADEIAQLQAENARLRGMQHRPRTLSDATKARQAEALSRATVGQSLTNYPSIYRGFLAKGIPEAEIKPRENVFTYEAWRALGRYVRKGEHGVRVITFRDETRKETDEETGEEKILRSRRPWSSVVFHISQTDACA